MRALVLIALAACGSPHALVDGGAGPDAGGADGAGGTAYVTVHINDGMGGGFANATVEAASAAGVIGATTTTGADGRAAIDATAGGMIVVTPAASSRIVIAGVKDGDALEIGAPTPPAEIGAASVDVPVEPTATAYTIYTGCAATDSGHPPLDVALYDACAGPHTIVVEAKHGTQAPTYLIAPGITLADGDEVALTGTWTAGATATVAVTGLPADGDPNSLDVERLALAAGRPVSRDAARPAIAGGAGSLSLSAPVGAGDRQFVEADYRRGTDSVFVFAETALGDASVDLATLPDVAWTGAGTWTLAGGSADGISGGAQFHDDATGMNGTLSFIAPPDATAIPVPAGVTIVGTSHTGMIVSNSAGGGYDGFRQHAAATIGITIAVPIAHDVRAAVRYF